VEKISYSQSWGKIDTLLLPRQPIRRGSMVTFKAPPEPDKEYVKRVIGLPGERICIVNNTVYINGSAIKEDYVTFMEDHSGQFHGENMGEQLVPADHYFCMGDNRWNSSDSRFWGPVHRDHIIGRPWLIYWSFEANRDDYRDTRFLAKIKSIAVTALSFFSQTRWERTIMPIR
jgi:signal peptidase I